MVLAIEPMSVIGSGEMQEGSFVSRDNSYSAHFEHTVIIKSKGGAEIVTK